MGIGPDANILGVIRPSGKTAVASTKIDPRPREAIPPTNHTLLNSKVSDDGKGTFSDVRWAICHGVRKPFAED